MLSLVFMLVLLPPLHIDVVESPSAVRVWVAVAELPLEVRILTFSLLFQPLFSYLFVTSVDYRALSARPFQKRVCSFFQCDFFAIRTGHINEASAIQTD